MHNVYDQKDSSKKKVKYTPAILSLVSKKFEMYSAYENGLYDPGYKLSLVSIAQQLNLGHSSIYHLYNEWLTDPTYSLRKSKLNDHSKEPKPSKNGGIPMAEMQMKDDSEEYYLNFV